MRVGRSFVSSIALSSEPLIVPDAAHYLLNQYMKNTQVLLKPRDIENE